MDLARRLILLGALVPGHLLAADEGVLTGRVTDQTGGVIAGAVVEVSRPGVRPQRAKTDGSGVYRIRGLAPAVYAVTVVKERFSPYGNGAVAVSAGTTTLDVELALAPVEEKLTVEEDRGLSTDPAANAGAIVIKGKDLESLPEDPDELAEALQALAGPSAGPNGGQIFIDGFTGGRLPPRATIREIRMNANPFSAEYDRLGFGRIEILTRPGSDRFRGQLSFGFNDEVLNSRNPFATNRPPFQRRDFSGNLSGPIATGKASFFLHATRVDVDDNDLVHATVLGPDLVPVPFAQAVLTPQHRTNLNPRVDYQIDDANTLVVRGSFSESRRPKAGIGEYSLPSRAYQLTSRQLSLQLTETAIIRKKVVSETRFQYQRDRREQVAESAEPTLQVLDAFTGGGSQVGRSHSIEERWELANVTSWTLGKHSFRAGARLRVVRLDDVSRQNFGGTLTFGGGLGPQLDANDQVVRGDGGRPVMVPLTSLERYRRTVVFQAQGLSPAEVAALGGGPSQLRIAGGDPQAGLTQWDVAPFVQDDWRVNGALTVSFGLRYEVQNHISSPLDFAPRLAFAWSPGPVAAGARPKTVIRGGFGVFYDRFGEDLVLQAERYDGVSQQQFLVTDPAVLGRIRFDGGSVTGVPSADTLTGFSLPQTTRRIAAGVETPYTLSASLSLERQLGSTLTFSAILVTSRVRRMLRSRNVTAPDPGGVRPPGATGTVYEYESTGRLNQDQMILGVNTTPGGGRRFSVFARYLLGWAKSDTDGAGSFPSNPQDPGVDYGWAGIDVRHRFILGGSVTLPWRVQLNPFVILSTGRPFNITTGRDNNGDTVFTDRPAFATDAAKPGVVSTPWGLLDPNPAPGQPSIPRNYGRGPGMALVNLRVAKTLGLGPKTGEAAPPGVPGRGPGGPMGPVPGGGRPGGDGGGRGAFGGFGEASGHRYSLTVSLSVSNLLNHVNAGPPVGNLSSPLFGKSTSTAGFGFGFGPGGGGGGGGSAGNRRVELQARFGF
jgi:hypothetical protein